MKVYNYLYEFTEEEFLDVVGVLMDESIEEAKGLKLSDDEFDKLGEQIADIIIRDVKHPLDIGLMFFPEHPYGDSPEKLVAEIKRHCEAEGIPCFRKA